MTLDWSERDKAFSLFGGRMTNEQDRLAQTMAVDGTLTLQYLQRRYGLNGPNAMKLQDDLAHVAAALRAPQGETLKSLRDWAGNRADQSAGRGKPDVFEAWREVVDKIDALLPPVSPAEPTTTDDQSRSGQSGESTSDPRGQDLSDPMDRHTVYALSSRSAAPDTVEIIASFVEHLRDGYASTAEPVSKVARLIRERFGKP